MEMSFMRVLQKCYAVGGSAFGTQILALLLTDLQPPGPAVWECRLSESILEETDVCDWKPNWQGLKHGVLLDLARRSWMKEIPIRDPFHHFPVLKQLWGHIEHDADNHQDFEDLRTRIAFCLRLQDIAEFRGRRLSSQLAKGEIVASVKDTIHVVREAVDQHCIHFEANEIKVLGMADDRRLCIDTHLDVD